MDNRATPSGPLAIGALLATDDEARQIQATLEHIYPGVAIERTTSVADLTALESDCFLVDTKRCAGAALEHLLDTLPDRPAVLIVDDFTEVRAYGQRLNGRRAVVARGDLAGMGLIQAIHHLLERQQLHEQLRRTARHLQELKTRDDLTGLANHRHFNEMLGREVKKANRYGRPLGLVMICVKDFTAINEKRGHREGDRILATAAELVRETVRDVDIPARYGDNEFCVILPETDEAAAGIVAERLQAALGTIRLGTGDDAQPLRTSIGIAALGGRIGTPEELLRTVLGALAAAKRGTRNAVCTAADIAARRKRVRENRQLIDQLHERLLRIARDAERSYFQSLIKAVSNIPLLKKQLLPHSERVAFFAKRLAESLDLGEEACRRIHHAGLLHDTGLIAIDPEIVTKPAKLTAAETDLVRQHPLFALQIIGEPPFLATELGAILHHHERFDGKGYPEGLAGEAIPLPSRILAIAEAWDAMTTPQPYRTKPLPFDAALAELATGAGTQFDPQLAQRFTALIAGS